MKSKFAQRTAIAMSILLTAGSMFTGCGNSAKSPQKVTLQVLNYKREAVDILEELAADFEKENPDIHIQLDSPSDATNILKTRLVKEDPPDIAMIGGDRAYADFVDADIMVDLSGYAGLEKVQDVYLTMSKQLELRQKEGQYCVPFASNAAGVLYNRDMFEKNGWEIPQTWDELMSLCQTIRDSGTTPFYFMLKDSWTGITPWNALAANLTTPDIYTEVSLGETTFAKNYASSAHKMDELLEFGQSDPFAYGYNDGCTAFGSGESAMLLQGNWAIPQILSANPDINIGSFTLPVSDQAGETLLVSGIDFCFTVMRDENLEACEKFMDFMLRDENAARYYENQNAVACLKGDFEVPQSLAEMASYWTEGKVIDFPDHHYPAELPAADMLQGYLMNKDLDTFLNKFDSEWQKTNRDLIAVLKEEKNN